VHLSAAIIVFGFGIGYFDWATNKHDDPLVPETSDEWRLTYRDAPAWGLLPFFLFNFGAAFATIVAVMVKSAGPHNVTAIVTNFLAFIPSIIGTIYAGLRYSNCDTETDSYCTHGNINRVLFLAVFGGIWTAFLLFSGCALWFLNSCLARHVKIIYSPMASQSKAPSSVETIAFA
jgi:hypothetical protein